MNTPNGIKTAVIAAAGRGTRMREYSDQYPKPLVPVHGEPFLHYVLEALRSIGCTRFIVVAGHRFAQVLEYVRQLSYPVEIINQQETVGDDYGTAVVLRAVCDRIHDEPFILYNGDMLYSDSILHTLHDDGYTHVLAASVENPREFGVVEHDGEGFLTSITEKPANPITNLVNLGLYVCQSDVIRAAEQVQRSPRGEYEFVDVLNDFASQKRVKVDITHGEWVTLTQPEDIPIIERFLTANKRV